MTQGKTMPLTPRITKHSALWCMCLVAMLYSQSHASFIKQPSRQVRMIDAIATHVSATQLSPDIGMVKLYLESVLNTRSQEQPFKTTAEILLKGLERTNELSQVLDAVTSAGKEPPSILDLLEAGKIVEATRLMEAELAVIVEATRYAHPIMPLDPRVYPGAGFHPFNAEQAKDYVDGRYFDGRKR